MCICAGIIMSVIWSVQLLLNPLLENQAPYAAESYFYGHIFFPETILTSPEPSVAGIDEKGHPVFAQEERDEFQMGYVELMQRSLMNFFEDYIANFLYYGPTD